MSACGLSAVSSSWDYACYYLIVEAVWPGLQTVVGSGGVMSCRSWFGPVADGAVDALLVALQPRSASWRGQQPVEELRAAFCFMAHAVFRPAMHYVVVALWAALREAVLH